MTSQNNTPITRDTILDSNMQEAVRNIIGDKTRKLEKSGGASGFGEYWNERVHIRMALGNLKEPTINKMQQEVLRMIDGFTGMSVKKREDYKLFFIEKMFPTDADLKAIDARYATIKQEQLEDARKRYEWEQSPAAKAAKAAEQERLNKSAEAAILDEEDRWEMIKLMAPKNAPTEQKKKGHGKQ